LDGFNSNGEYAYVDDIVIVELVADTSVSFKINGQQVYFNSSGKPLQGSHPLTPSASLRGDKTQALVNETTYFPGSYFYSVRVEVTDLINEFGTLAPSPATNRPGNDSYTVGDVSGDLNTQISNAGWSLVIVYSSAETKGNQLYLYDNFITSGDNTQSVDFDGDGEPGGTIGGFLVPEKEPEETLAARLTAFVIEGDDYYDGDYIALNGTKLWDNTTTGGNTSQDPDDVWNGVSLGMSADGVDVDTFEVPWGNPVSSGLLVPGVSSAQIDMHTGTDIWQMVYIIISFRSESTTGGAISYLIQ
jgi:hypothetical protein